MNSRFRYIAFGAAAIIGLLFPLVAAGLEDNDAYTTTSDKLWTVDLETGAESLVGEAFGNSFLAGLTFDPLTAMLYAISDEHILTLSLEDGAGKWVGEHGLEPLFGQSGLAFDREGNLYLVTDDSTYTIDTATGAATLLGSNGMSNSAALAFSPAGKLYALGEPGELGGIMGLVEIDITTGAIAEVIGPLEDPVDPGPFLGGLGIDFDSAGVLYMVNAGRDGLYTVSLEDATVTRVADLALTQGSLAIFPDCNSNGVHDGYDLVQGTSEDANADGIPDECPVCGDGNCDDIEDLCSCDADCGIPPAQEEVGNTCDDGFDNDCDTLVDCDDPDCDDDPYCGPPPIPGGPGDLFVTTDLSDWVERFDGVTGQFLHKFTTGPTLVGPSGITIGPDGLLYVSGINSRNVVRYNIVNGELLGEFVVSEAGGLDEPWSITFGPDGHLYVSERSQGGVRRYDGSTGEYIDEFVASSGGHLFLATDLTFGPDGHLYVVSNGDHRVVRFDGATGDYIDDFVSSGDGGLVIPTGLTFSDDGYLYVASNSSQGAVYRYDAGTGEFVDVFVEPGSGGLNKPFGLAFGPDGNLYLPSETNNIILRFDGQTGEFIGGFVYGPFIDNTRYLVFQPPECSTDADCDDGDSGTIDSCYTWRCAHSPFTRLYVDADALGSGSGLSWTDAFTDLQDALDAADAADGPIDIWVAEGTYKPDRDTQDRHATFQLLDGVSLYGGFIGTERELDERDPYTHTTILSGDLAGNDEDSFINYEENSYHVVTGSGSGVDAPTLVDGFLIGAGNANGQDFEAPKDRGGGMLTLGGSPQVLNCTFSANWAILGGGMHNEDYSRTILDSCGFFGNLADTSGGGMANHSMADSIITNCIFSGNTASEGGALYMGNNSRPTLTNCTVAANTATTAGGGLYGNSSYTTLSNSILWFNSDSTGNGESAQFGGSTTWTINYCCIMGWTGDFGGVENTGDCNPEFQDPNGEDNILGTPDDNYRLPATSPCVDVGDNDADSDAFLDGLQPIPETDADGNARIYHDVVDKGAYEFFDTLCEGDANADGAVDPLDSGFVLARFGCPVGTGDPDCDAADVNGDGSVDPLDSGYVLARFGVCP